MAFQKHKKMTLLCETGNIRFDRFFSRKKKPSAVLKLSGDHPLPLVPHLISNNTNLQVLKSDLLSYNLLSRGSFRLSVPMKWGFLDTVAPLIYSLEPVKFPS